MPEDFPAPLHSAAGAPAWMPPAPDHLEAMLPQYDEWVMIGCGGMGAVYRARQISLDRPVAIKVLPPQGGEDAAEFIQRFTNEARTMARMNHPAIVAVHDFGATQDGLLYFAMEYIDGTDVFKMVHSQGRLPPEHALSITAHVCDALAYAHDHKVIHRDIKPANILINMEGAVKVADFGLASIHDPSQEGGAQETSTMGTPDYVAPEVLILGTTVDGRADLYAVGVMLYNMLTGDIPRHACKPASQKCGCDPRFDAIIRKAMERDVTQRYQSAREIRRDLDRIMTVPVAKEQPAPRPRGGMQPRPMPQAPPPKGPPWGLIAAAVAVLVGAGLFFLKRGSAPAASAASTLEPGTNQPPPPQPLPGDPIPATKAPQPALSAVIQTAADAPKGSPLSELPVVSHGGHHYQVVGEQYSQQAAQEHAVSLGGHLLTITSQEEMDWLDQALPPLLKQVPQWMATTGGIREGGTWRWLTGEPFSYTRWDPTGSAPDSEPEKKFALKITAKGAATVWGNGHLDGKRGFIIEWDSTPEPAPGSPVPPPRLPVAITPETEGTRRLRELETQFRAALEREVLSKHRTAVADLDAKYTAALDRTLTASAPPEAAALRGEKDRVASGAPLPQEDPPELSATLKTLRSTYRVSQRPLELARHNGIITFFLRYEEVLKGLEAEWAKAGKSGDASQAAMRLRTLAHERATLLEEAKELVPEGKDRVLTGREKFTTPESFRPPVEITLVAKTDKQNLRLAYTAKQVIFNWEVNSTELRLDNDFAGGRHAPGQGQIPEDTFVALRWLVMPHMQSLTVNGERRYLHFGDYSKLDKAIEVFPSGSTVTLKSLKVRPLDLQVLEEQVSSVPELKELFLNPADWTGKIDLSVGTYRPLRRINIGAPGTRDPRAQNDEQRADVTSQPGTRFENVRFHLKEGSWKAAGGLFRDVKITADLGGVFEAQDSLFENCAFAKEGPWYVAWFSSKWSFANCVFTGSFLQNWRLGDVGVKLNGCTFYDVDFLSPGFKEDAGVEVAKDWLSIQNCRFINCRVPEGFALATKNCVFEQCTFGPPVEKLPLKSPLNTILYLQETATEPKTGEGRTFEVRPAAQAPAGVGAGVKHRRNGSRLDLE